MSTKQQTNSNNSSQLQYDPTSKGNYNALTGAGTNVLTGYMKNPLNNPFFNLSGQMAQKGAAQQGQNNMNALMQQMRTSGFGGASGSGFSAAQTAKTGRANAGMSSQANLGNIMQALQRQMTATGMGMSFNPLMTGTTSQGQQTQTTSGLGTWLPQLLGAGLGAATSFIPHGGGGGGGMGFMGAGSGGSVASQGMSDMNARMAGSMNAFSPLGGAAPPNPFMMGGF